MYMQRKSKLPGSRLSKGSRVWFSAAASFLACSAATDRQRSMQAAGDGIVSDGSSLPVCQESGDRLQLPQRQLVHRHRFGQLAFVILGV